MEEVTLVIRPCWNDILMGFLAIGWSPEDLDYAVSKEGGSYAVRFTKVLFAELQKTAEKKGGELEKFLALETRPDPESDSNILIFAPNGWTELTAIQYALSVTVRGLRAEWEAQLVEIEVRRKTERGEEKIMLMLQLEDAMKDLKIFGFEKAHIKYRKEEDKYFAKVIFKKKTKGGKKLPDPWRNRNNFSPLGILVEFKDFIKTLE